MWMLTFILMVMMVNAVDDTSWTSAGKDQYYSHRVPYTASTEDYASSCLVSGAGINQPVIDNLDGDANNTPEIVVVRNDNLYVYDTSCNEIDTIYDSDLDNRQPTIHESLDCLSGKGIFLLTSNTIEQWCFSGGNLTQQDTIASTGDIDDEKGISMVNISGVPKGAFLTNDNGTIYMAVCTFNGGVGCIYASETGLSWSGLIKLPVGNIDIDGDLDFVVYNPSSDIMWISDFSLSRFSVNVSDATMTAITGIYQDVTRDDVILHGEYCYAGGCPPSNEGYRVAICSYSGLCRTAYDVKSAGGLTPTSNTIQLGQGGDVCFSWYKNDGYAPYRHNRITCADDTGVTTLDANIGNIGHIYEMTSSDMNGDSFADFITNKGIFYYNNPSSLSRVTHTHMDSWAYAIDLDNDIYRDLIMFGSTGLNISLTEVPPAEYDLKINLIDCGSGSPVALADVSVIGEGLLEATDIYGNVSFEDIGLGSYDIQVNKFGYDIVTFEDIDSRSDGEVTELCIGDAEEEIVLSNIQDSACGLTASIFWETNTNTDSRITWWKSGESSQTSYYDETTQQHSMQIFDLDAGTLYFYSVQSCYHGESCTLQSGGTFITGNENDLCAGQCSEPCIFYDDFNYYVPISSKGWYLAPTIYDDVAPYNNEFCRNASSGVWGTDALRHDTQTGSAYDIYTHSFNLKLESGASFSMNIRYLDSTDVGLVNVVEIGGNQLNATHFNLWSLHDDELGEYSDTNDPPIILTYDEYHTIKIVQYWDSLNRKFLNYSNGEIQPIKEHTYAVIVDDDINKSWFNLDFYHDIPDGHSIMLEDFTFDYWNDADICLDDISVYAGTTFNESDLFDYVETIDVDEVFGCWNTDTGEFMCDVSGCQDCCEWYNGRWRIKSTMCIIGKWFGGHLDKLEDWILSNILKFLLLVLILILIIPIALKFHEIKNNNR